MANILDSMRLKGKIIAVLENVNTGDMKVIEGRNLVTDYGDKYYAQSAAGESVSVDMDGTNSGLRLGWSNAAPNKTSGDVVSFYTGTIMTLDTGYEKTSDNDTDNTGGGADIVTWRYSYATDVGNVSNIIEGAICGNRTTPTGSDCLTRFTFAASFTKTSSDTLKIFVNHNFYGTA
jgi:hypothetical protein